MHGYAQQNLNHPSAAPSLVVGWYTVGQRTPFPIHLALCHKAQNRAPRDRQIAQRPVVTSRQRALTATKNNSVRKNCIA